ncbi:restriction endonuclease subunit S [Pedobacter aquae]|uniref:Restriction endonuclease subunit S n=1 Tax=Pedobacter aquae TaxID=2605747 RepID=A0A5C0VE17_9SPHI|nr:restriction endonuclease subunit S [Pedobacter aquae]QEK50925.1 restriction endonuclease subunit S [Pedobacter aquae]
MAKTNTNPEVRFAGFTEAWEERELGDVAKFNPKHEIPDVFNYVDLESVVGTEMISYRKEYKITAPSRAQRLAEKGDVFYQTVRPYQKNNLLFDREDKDFVFSTGYAQMRPVIESSFLFTLIQKDEFVRVVLNNCTGTSYPAINSTVLASIKLYFPKSKDEQTQIGNFFENLDNLITENQQKHTKLQSLKQAMLDKMFPKQGQLIPEIRFKGFEGNWEEINVGSICKTTIGVFVIKTRQNDLSPYPVYNGGVSYTGFYDEYNNEANKIVISARGANAGFVNIVRTKYWAGNSCYSVDVLDKGLFDIDFLFYYIKKYQRRFLENQQSANIPSVSKSDVERFKVFYPSKTEQSAIAKYLLSLDNQISNHDLQIIKLQNIKKAFLAKMFI